MTDDHDKYLKAVIFALCVIALWWVVFEAVVSALEIR